MGLVKVYKALIRLLSGGPLPPLPPVPLLMTTSEDFSVPFHSLIKLCYTKTLKWSSLFPGPKAKSSTLEITNSTPFTLSYHNQANEHVHHFHFCHFPFFFYVENYYSLSKLKVHSNIITLLYTIFLEFTFSSCMLLLLLLSHFSCVWLCATP